MEASYKGFQGDVHIAKIKKLPSDVYQDAQSKNAILAYGEASGHAHQFDQLEDVEVYKSEKNNNVIYLDVKRRTSISHGRARDFVGKEVDHDYHNVIWLDPGVYVSGIVKETDWLTGHIRRVVD